MEYRKYKKKMVIIIALVRLTDIQIYFMPINQGYNINIVLYLLEIDHKYKYCNAFMLSNTQTKKKLIYEKV